MSHASYLDKLVPAKFTKTVTAMTKLIKAEFPECNMIIGRGVSGAMLIPALAARLKVEWAIARKNDDSHSSYHCEASEWPKYPQVVFVDDLIDSGSTFKETKQSMERRNPVAGIIGAALYHYEYNYYGQGTIDGVPIRSLD